MRAVIENCLYGVDLNPLAVDLAKLALWLETVARDRPLTFLDHHLRHGNSLIGARLRDLPAPGGTGGLLARMFAAAFARKLPALLEPLADIRRLPSDTVKAVKDKGTRFAAYEKAVEPFRRLGHLWAADAAGHPVPGDKYTEAAREVDKPKRFDALAAEDWFAAAAAFAAKLAPFHWDLAFPEVFADARGPVAGGGFDVVVGNPPYEVLSAKESGADPSALNAVAKRVPAFRPAVRGKQNLYKLFVCRAADVLRDGGRLGFITPMAVLGDDQAVGIRKLLIGTGRFTAVEAFPQKDDPKRRVFADAKLSTAVFAWVKGDPGGGDGRFPSRLRRANVLDDEPLGDVALATADIPLYDPENLTVVSCAQDDWDLAVRLMKSGRMVRLGKFVEFFQGEVNETNARAAGQLAKPGEGQLVVRGASLCLYAARAASQGEDLYLLVDKFREGKGADTKAYHHLHPRVGVQESSPQNNFRRIIAAHIPAGEFCNHTINYCTSASSTLDLRFVSAVLNTLLADWYFRLGSTNAHVSHYQLGSLPCPHFRASASEAERAAAGAAVAALAGGRLGSALTAVGPLLEAAPFGPAVQDVVVAAVGHVIAAERARGDMSRSDRSALSAAAQPYQDFLDAVFFRLAGLTDEEVRALRARYEQMKKVK